MYASLLTKRTVMSLLGLAIVTTLSAGILIVNSVSAAQPANVIHVKITPNTTALTTVVKKSKAQKTQKLFKSSAVARDAARSQSAPDRASVELNKYYKITVGPGVNKAELVAQLKKEAGVEEAYVAPTPVPAPAVPDFTSRQTYTNTKTYGVGTSFAATWPGGKGGSVCVYDMEYLWFMEHQDLSKTRLPGAYKQFGTPADPFNDPTSDHGTAAVGILSADNNGFGVTGMVPDARLGLVNAFNTDGYDPAGAIYHAASTMAPGCVLLLEQQTGVGPNEFVPLEWIPSVYDAIKFATASGIVVVEPAGNGNVNLDDPRLGTTFPDGKIDSGAIVVGAGNHCAESTAKLARKDYSSYGKRVNVQGPGECVVSTGVGDLYGDTRSEFYTAGYAGTSSGSAVIAGTAAAYTSAYMKLNGVAPTPAAVRSVLVSTGTAQNLVVPGKIGPLPNLEKALLTTDKKAPTAPRSLKITRNAKRQPVLKWIASTDNVKVASYQVIRNGVVYATVTSGTTYTDTRAVKGKYYTYKVRALDRTGNKSASTATLRIRR